ncbi:M48 family metallopeptidase [Pelomicrobium methylotrophicum]|uniref:M48 family metallopeptidase n=2 Tax=Pelomicrobium methylotrophicum TaxID=2602750 RepID=A0A5C7EN03_9PROT|nr:M48 family metallopeptidase [Pelomicrobium methylotrophicum]
MDVLEGSPMMRSLLALAAAAWLAAGCATNPVTGRSQLMIVSESQAIAASRQAYVQMLAPLEKQGKVNEDPALKARIDRIAERLVAQAVKYRPETAHWDWEIKVIHDPKTVNAWAMAGGKMAIYTGLIDKLNASDDEIAQVLGHEIAHALSAHTAEKMSVALASDLVVTGVAVASDRPQLAATGAALAAALAVQMPNSRTMEAEADRIGIELAAKAGYNPRAALTLWDKMAKLGESRPPEFLSTHPSPETRRRALEALLPQMLVYYQQPGPRPTHPVK